MKVTPLFEIPFHHVTLTETLEILSDKATSSSVWFCTTPNPEMCLAAWISPSFLKTLQAADLSLADGFGILWATRYLNGKRNLWRWLVTLLSPRQTRKTSVLPERVTGSDVVREMTKHHPDLKYFLLGASEEVNHSLSTQLRSKGVQVVGNYSGNDSEKLAPMICSMINASEAQVLFVAFGAPRQEQWIQKHLPELKTVRVAMGIGGAFDFLVGKRKRAPRWMQQMGLEWLFRLIIEPKRFARIFNATVVFPLQVYLRGRRMKNEE